MIVLVFSAPINYGRWRYADWLMALLIDDAKAISLGATYLSIAMLALPFRSWSLVARRWVVGPPVRATTDRTYSQAMGIRTQNTGRGRDASV